MARTNTQGNLHQNATGNDGKRQESADSTVESQGRLNFDPNSVTGGSAGREPQRQEQDRQAQQPQRKAAAADDDDMRRLAELKRVKVSAPRDIDLINEDDEKVIAEEDAAFLAERARGWAAEDEAARLAAESLRPATIPMLEPRGSGQAGEAAPEPAIEEDNDSKGMKMKIKKMSYAEK